MLKKHLLEGGGGGGSGISYFVVYNFSLIEGSLANSFGNSHSK